MTLHYGVPHGIACSFTLPTVLRSVSDLGGFRGDALAEIFGGDIHRGADNLAAALQRAGVGTRFADYGIDRSAALEIVEAAFVGQRGRNFIGEKQALLSAAQAEGLLA